MVLGSHSYQSLLNLVLTCAKVFGNFLESFSFDEEPEYSLLYRAWNVCYRGVSQIYVPAFGLNV